MRSNFSIKRQQADSVPLMVGKIAQGCREHPRVIDLGDAGRPIVHGSADIEQNQYARVRLALEKLDVELVASRKDVPVDAPDLIAGHVLAIGREIDAETQIWRPVESLDKPFHDCPRDQLEILNLYQNLGIDETVYGLLLGNGRTHEPSLSIRTLE